MRDKDTWRVMAEVSPSEAEMAEFVLGELGSLGSVEETTQGGDRVRISSYFDRTDHDRNALRDLVIHAFAPYDGLKDAWIEVELEPACDWNEKWRKQLGPFAIAQNMIVVPSWVRYEPKPGEVIIHLDPGMAFGTGLHETTRLCAEALGDELKKDNCQRVLDVGTGSGMLAIVARRLGAKSIAGVDNAPEALRVAAENFRKNSCDDIQLHDELASVSGQFDIVVANILLPTLIELKSLIERHTAPGGLIILSGITRDQEEEIQDSYLTDFAFLAIAHKGEWSAISLRRRG